MKILFVCRGNVGRSVIAEAFLKDALEKSGKASKYTIASAGTKLSGPEQPIGELRPGIDIILNTMQEVGIDVSGYVRQNITPEMIADADKIILVVDERDPIPDELQNNPKVSRWEVLDPKGQTQEFANTVRDQIKVFVNDLVKTLD